MMYDDSEMGLLYSERQNASASSACGIKILKNLAKLADIESDRLWQCLRMTGLRL